MKTLGYVAMVLGVAAYVAWPLAAAAQVTDYPKVDMRAQAASVEATDHSNMDHSKMDHATMGHVAPTDPEAGADAGVEGMDHSRMDAMPTRQAAPNVPIEPIPVLTDSDRAAARPAAHRHVMDDGGLQRFVLFNRLESWHAGPGTGTAWEGQAWFGTDLRRLWLRSEGERVDGRTESTDLEALYGRSVARWWDVVAGVRHDFRPRGPQDFVAFGVMGLAPQKFEIEATVYLGEKGQTAARVEAEYELLLTNRWILQPLVEANGYGKDDPARGIGAGLATVEAGFRLRYEVSRRFAPYVGIVRERAFGNTADLRRAEGKDEDDTRVVAGVRVWF